MHRRRFLTGFAKGLAGVPLARAVLRAANDRLARLGADLDRLSDPDEYWRRVRDEFQFRPGLVHLNCGSLGATPRLILDAVAGFAADVEGNPVSKTFSWGGERMEEVRHLAADFLGAGVSEVALTRNTTEAMNAVALGIDWKPGDQVLTTNHEHGGGMVCWQHVRKHHGVDVTYVELPRRVDSANEILNLIADRITPRTRACSFSHIDTITGLQMPIAQIAEVTRPRDIVLVCDGAQAPGMVAVDVKALGVDAYACSSHKWMLGPKGTGLLYIREEAQDRVHPMFLHSGYNSYSASGGTRGVDRVLGQGLALEFHNIIGRDRIEARCRQLRRYLSGALSDFPRLEQLTPDQDSMSGGIVTYAIDGSANDLSSAEVRRRMDVEHDIQIKAVQSTYAYCEESGLAPENYNAVRFSTHIYNDEAGIDRAVGALRKAMR